MLAGLQPAVPPALAGLQPAVAPLLAGLLMMLLVLLVVLNLLMRLTTRRRRSRTPAPVAAPASLKAPTLAVAAGGLQPAELHLHHRLPLLVVLVVLMVLQELSMAVVLMLVLMVLQQLPMVVVLMVVLMVLLPQLPMVVVLLLQVLMVLVVLMVLLQQLPPGPARVAADRATAIALLDDGPPVPQTAVQPDGAGLYEARDAQRCADQSAAAAAVRATPGAALAWPRGPREPAPTLQLEVAADGSGAMDDGSNRINESNQSESRHDSLRSNRDGIT